MNAIFPNQITALQQAALCLEVLLQSHRFDPMVVENPAALGAVFMDVYKTGAYDRAQLENIVGGMQRYTEEKNWGRVGALMRMLEVNFKSRVRLAQNGPDSLFAESASRPSDRVIAGVKQAGRRKKPDPVAMILRHAVDIDAEEVEGRIEEMTRDFFRNLGPVREVLALDEEPGDDQDVASGPNWNWLAGIAEYDHVALTILLSSRNREPAKGILRGLDLTALLGTVAVDASMALTAMGAVRGQNDESVAPWRPSLEIALKNLAVDKFARAMEQDSLGIGLLLSGLVALGHNGAREVLSRLAAEGSQYAKVTLFMGEERRIARGIQSGEIELDLDNLEREIWSGNYVSLRALFELVQKELDELQDKPAAIFGIDFFWFLEGLDYYGEKFTGSEEKFEELRARLQGGFKSLEIHALLSLVDDTEDDTIAEAAAKVMSVLAEYGHVDAVSRSGEKV